MIMRRKWFNIILLLTVIAILVFITTGSCNKSPFTQGEEEIIPQQETEIKGDSMVYGLSCDGTTDSVIVIYPFGGDPVTYSCIEAKQKGRIIGKPQIGDWIGVMVNKDDSTEVDMVIDLDQLKGTWTYPVMPVMKELQNMSPRMQKRMMANMPDSVKETYFVPREYGFTLKRGHVAQAVGRVRRSNSLADDSPVQYPEVRNYKEWHMLNGSLILVSGLPDMLKQDNTKQVPDKLDTLQFVYMDEDSLILTYNGARYGFHRKTNALKANEAAQKAQEKQESKK